MKQLLVAILLLVIYSCSEGEEEIPELNQGFPQTWQLSSLTIGLSGEVLIGTELPYQETLQLATDGTFIKTRTVGDAVTTASGTFEIVPFEGTDFLILSHTERTDLLENCSNTLEERFRMDSATSISGGAIACDGAGLIFERAY